MNIAIIPARGGSKRIPKKNIRDFCGKPVIAYSIECALKSGLFEHVIVSTDDEEIASIAREYGAEIPFIRPAEISDDHTGTNTVVKHSIEWFKKQGKLITNTCCVYATAPFIQIKYLIEGYEKLLELDESFSFSVTTYPFPVQRALRITEMGRVDAIWSNYINSRSQDLEEAYHDAGQFYWGKADAFLKNVVLFSPKSVPVVLPRHLVQDIDTPEDWRRAELMYQVLIANGELNT